MNNSQDSDRLAGIRVKLGRARKHIEDFESAVGTYIRTDPYRVDVVKDTNPDVVAIYLRIAEEPPLCLSAALGDAIQNMRSALDYLAWQLVLAIGKTPNIDPPRTQFPVYTSRTNSKGNPRNVTIPPGIDPKALTIVKSIQPYARADNSQLDPLAVLAELSNRDKHRTLNLTAHRSTDTRAEIVNTRTGDVRSSDIGITDAQDQDMVGMFFGTIASDEQPAIYGSSFVGFKEPGPWGQKEPVVAVLERLYNYLDGVVVAKLKPFLL